jgi:hypothetical protein
MRDVQKAREVWLGIMIALEKMREVPLGLKKTREPEPAPFKKVREPEPALFNKKAPQQLSGAAPDAP